MTGVESSISIIVVLLLFTSFVKITTALSIVRYGIGLTGFEFGIVTLVIAFAVSVVSSPPELRDAGVSSRVLFQPNTAGDSVKIAQALVPYMRAHTDPEVLNVLMSSYSHSLGQDPQGTAAKRGPQDDLYAEIGDVGAVFVLSELKAAVSVAALVLVPFIIIDLLVAHLIALLGMQHLRTHIVSLPLKLMLFLAVDGWSLLISKLVAN